MFKEIGKLAIISQDKGYKYQCASFKYLSSIVALKTSDTLCYTTWKGNWYEHR